MPSPFEDFLGATALPEARKAFRSELRRRFVQGDLERTGGEEIRRARPRRRAPGPAPVHRPRWLAPLAAAAALLVAFLGYRLGPWGADGTEDPGGFGVAGRPAPAWRVSYLGEEGPVRVDGRELAPGEVGLLVGQLFAADAPPRISSEDCRLLLTWNDELVLELAEGTELRTAALGAPADPAAGAARREPALFRLARGEVLVRTVEGFDGGPLLFRTPEAEVLVTGTTLGIKTGGYTCVCVREGEVTVTDRATGESFRVSGSNSRLVYGDGEVQDLRLTDVGKDHSQPLYDLYERDLGLLFR